MKSTRKVYVLIAIVAIIVIVAVIGFRIYNKPHRVVKTAQPAFTMTATQLVDQFAEDETDANALYAGKIIQLNGRLKDIIRNDSTIILLLGDTSQMMSVSCYLQSGERLSDAALTSGDMVTVKGICNGMLMDVIIDKAILLTDEIR